MIELDIKTENWTHTCGDGCCHTYGTDVFINDEKVSQGDYHCIDTILIDVLESLGHKVNLV